LNEPPPKPLLPSKEQPISETNEIDFNQIRIGLTQIEEEPQIPTFETDEQLEDQFQLQRNKLEQVFSFDLFINTLIILVYLLFSVNLRYKSELCITI
jgi:hypothetical protein